MKNNVTFEDVNYIVVKPNARVEREAKSYASIKFADALRNGVPTKESLKKYFEEEDSEKVAASKEEFRVLSSKLSKGGYSKFDARKDALRMHEIRMSLLSENSVHGKTAEAIYDDAYNDYVMYKCTKHEDGRPVYTSAEDYADKSLNELSKFLRESIQDLSDIKSVMDSLEEIQFLKKYGFMNEDYELVNEHGQKVNSNYEVVEEVEFTEFT